jgi:hypothetical protein
MGLLCLLSAMPLAAQIANSVDFTTPFPFYAGNTTMPAGAYKITQSDIEASIWHIQSNDGVHSSFVDTIPTYSAHSHPSSDVAFQKYGGTEYLDRVWLEGQDYGMKLIQIKLK